MDLNINLILNRNFFLTCGHDVMPQTYGVNIYLVHHIYTECGHKYLSLEIFRYILYIKLHFFLNFWVIFGLILNNFIPIEAELSQVYLFIWLYFVCESFPFFHKINTNSIFCSEIRYVYSLFQKQYSL